MGRRRFVKTLVAAGFSVASASRLSASHFEAVGTDEVPIVYAYARDDPGDPASIAPQITTVGAEWYNDLQAALSSYETFDPTAIEGVIDASIVPGDGEERTRVSVNVTDEGIVSTVSDLLEGTPVEGSVVEPTADGSRDDLEPTRRFDPDGGFAVPGGVACGDTGGLATLAPAVYDPETGSRYFATADHLYAGVDDPELTLVTDEGRVPIGEATRHYRREDLALVEPTGDFTPAHALDGEEPRPVAGQFTRMGLAALKARGAEIHKISAMTGHSTGEIQAIDGVTCVYGDPCKRGQLKWGSASDFTDGDSGSVSFAPDPANPEQVLVCGLNNARTWWPGEDYVWGTAAYVFQEEYGYTF
ncbi:hypothetical protein C497_13176 [Halalkalicoccus jeotgali B3]|uniref:Uncharacterized protein n=2 Tax=Halalkalicoccus jeotgali TaxID=413810 RepID=D8J3H6_HALJB|nr:hypothetical protein [Halalkalicoccus jeotgali]ADJ15283.1 hypothetical protein HacjB3_09500 [Halalkalicoccus jeotgali B3]ELY35296.1 hypothetical protein C497_13176 [Halalkalicoccus jeotgali B3]